MQFHPGAGFDAQWLGEAHQENCHAGPFRRSISRGCVGLLLVQPSEDLAWGIEIPVAPGHRSAQPFAKLAKVCSIGVRVAQGNLVGCVLGQIFFVGNGGGGKAGSKLGEFFMNTRLGRISRYVWRICYAGCAAGKWLTPWVGEVVDTLGWRAADS